MSGRPPRIIVDCDPGQDDAVALAVAAHYGDLVAVTTVSGNAPLADVTNNALLTCQIFDIDAAVYAGASGPLRGEPLHAPEIHGPNGFSGSGSTDLTRTVEETSAVEFLVEAVRAEEGLWLVQLGPATNIALAIQQAPDLPGRLAGISFMGGSATGGNRTAWAEFNAMADPEALAAVVACGAELRMCGLDLTTQFVVDDEFETAIRALSVPGSDGSPSNRGALVIADLFAHYLDRVEALSGKRRGGLHDPCAVLAVTHADLFEMMERPVGVELTGTLTTGMTVVDLRDRRPDRPTAEGFHPVRHCFSIDAATARRLVIDAIAERGGRV